MAAWRENQRTPLFFQLVGKINRGLIIDMAVVDSFNSFWILAQHALVGSAGVPPAASQNRADLTG